MNKKRLTSLLLLLSSISIVGAMSFSAGPILQEAIAQAGISSGAGVANQTAANNAMSSYLPPGLAKSIIDQARNTNATKYALQHAIGATTAAMNKTAGMNATTAAGMNATTTAKSVLNITRNTNATSFAANNIINATKNTTALKH